MCYKLIIITQENKESDKKIPYISNKMGIEAININQFCKKENWKF
jgi:hypothetical protein